MKPPRNAIACPAYGCRAWKLPFGAPVCTFCMQKVPHHLVQAWHREYYEGSNLSPACAAAAQAIIDHFKPSPVAP